jgi:hypothetical protein
VVKKLNTKGITKAHKEIITPDIPAFIDNSRDQGENISILPDFTAILKLRNQKK